MTQPTSGRAAQAAEIARHFVRARREAVALDSFPGTPPQSLDEAYAIQDAAIVQWPDQVCGWKVGRIAVPLAEQFGADRLVGPVFTRGVRETLGDAIVRFPVFEGGFAAVEAEFVVRLAADAPAGKTHWTTSEAAGLVGALHVGIETAGSPLAAINDLGPTVIVSDFGNNAGLILGPRIETWPHTPDHLLSTETFVEAHSVGKGTAASVPGGPLAALAFALGCCARRGLPLKAGQLVSTGATTGVHDIRAGQSASAMFGGVGEIRCRAVRAPRT